MNGDFFWKFDALAWLKNKQNTLFTSKGKPTKEQRIRQFGFHPKIRCDMGKSVFYVWIAVFANAQNEKDLENAKIHFCIFKSDEVNQFDDINLPTYQITDNQKTSLRINIQGEVLNKGKKHSYACFKDFHNHFKILE